MKSERLQRVLRMVTVLQSGRYFSPDELSEQLGVSRRTIFRDLDMLRKAGIPYYHDDEKGGYKISSSFFLPPLNLKLREALALLLLTRNPSGTMPLQREVQQAAMKIESALPAHVQRHCGSLLEHSSIQSEPYTHDDKACDNFLVLQKAINQKRKVDISYNSFYEQREVSTTLHPFHLHFSRRAWYVIGYSTLHGELRTFKLSRIKSILVQPRCFVQERPFDIDDYLGKAWALIPEGKLYKVKLLFAPMVAANVAEVLWHQGQKLTRNADGTLLFEVEVDGLGEISWWIMGYADQVEVLEPVQLRQRIANMAQNVINKYDVRDTSSREKV